MLDRRSLLAGAAAALALGGSAELIAQRRAARAGVKAVAFDAFAIFDPAPILRSCEGMFPGRGAELAGLWRTRQFEYQWLRALGGKYQDFWQVTRSALEFAAKSLRLDLSGGRRDLLMAQHLALNAWPDVADALARLRRSGRRLVILSNATREMLDVGICNAGLQDLFEAILTTEQVRSFKPSPRAYQLGVEALRLTSQEITFVASAGWDAAGARWFGYTTFWNNRQHAIMEGLDASPDGTGASLDDLVRFLEIE